MIDQIKTYAANPHAPLPGSEIYQLFVSTLSEVYLLKSHLMSYLPLMSQKVSYPALKTAIMNLSIGLSAHLLRIDIIFRLLDYQQSDKQMLSAAKSHIECYLMPVLDAQPSCQNDFMLLNHLMMIEAIEVTYFRSLKALALGLKKHEVTQLVEQSFEEAVLSKRTIKTLPEAFVGR